MIWFYSLEQNIVIIIYRRATARTFGTERRGFSPGAECQKSERTAKYRGPIVALRLNVCI